MDEKQPCSLLRRLLQPPTPLRWLLWLLYAAAWTTALLSPVPEMPEATGLRRPLVHFLFSKAVHLSAYALFAILTLWLRAPRRWRPLLFGLVVAHTGMTEFLQTILPTHRTGCVADGLLDLIGISLGVAVSWHWRRTASMPAPAPVASPSAATPGPSASATAR